MHDLTKLQIRAKVLSVISEIKLVNEFSETLLNKFCSELISIDDKNTVFDILIKEYIKTNENEGIFISFIIKKLINPDYIEQQVFKLLESANYSDETKYKLIELLKTAGIQYDFNTLPQYFEKPSEILDSETKKLLETAAYNPESMLDFLDFVSAVNDKDKNLLLDSLKSDYSGDILANIIYPVLLSDFDDNIKIKTAEILGDSKSSLAIEPLQYIIKTSDNSNLVKICNTGLKKLKLSGASEEKADIYFKNIIKNSSPADFFTTIPDGGANQALLISRITKEKKYLLSAVVINDINGITDCFGFYNISQAEMVKILAKFYKTEGKYKVPSSYVKTRINHAVDITIKNKHPFPYEFICWNVLTKDIEPLNNSLEEIVKTQLPLADIDKNTIIDTLTKDYSFRWYIKPNENNTLKEITDKIYSNDNIDIKEINKLIKENKNIIFSEEINKIWKDKILNCIYLLYTNYKKQDAQVFLAILNNEEYFDLFKIIIIQRSIFNHFAALKEASKDTFFTANIFRKKQKESDKINVKKVETIIETLTKNWLNDE